jgi:hypothetical protein
VLRRQEINDEREQETEIGNAEEGREKNKETGDAFL